MHAVRLVSLCVTNKTKMRALSIHYEQKMISQLPKWVEIGAFLLALVAGFVNAVGLMGFEHQAISHLSGTATQLGASAINDSMEHSFHLLGILLSFFFGASLAGFYFMEQRSNLAGITTLLYLLSRYCCWLRYYSWSLVHFLAIFLPQQPVDFKMHWPPPTAVPLYEPRM